MVRPAPLRGKKTALSLSIRGMESDPWEILDNWMFPDVATFKQQVDGSETFGVCGLCAGKAPLVSTLQLLEAVENNAGRHCC